MQVNGHHYDLDSPPNILAITGQPQQKHKREQPLTEALIACATALTDVLMKSQESCEPPCSLPSSTHSSADRISADGKAKLCDQYLQQLNVLQQLRENAALTQEEFKEQKAFIFNNIKGIHKYDWLRVNCGNEQCRLIMYCIVTEANNAPIFQCLARLHYNTVRIAATKWQDMFK